MKTQQFAREVWLKGDDAMVNTNDQAVDNNNRRVRMSGFSVRRRHYMNCAFSWGVASWRAYRGNVAVGLRGARRRGTMAAVDRLSLCTVVACSCCVVMSAYSVRRDDPSST